MGEMGIGTKRQVAWRVGVALLISLAIPVHAGRVDARSPRAARCWGALQVTPMQVSIGGSFAVQGSRFTCTAPNDKLFPTAALIFYRPALGFAIFTLRVQANGTYGRSIRVPARLRAVSALSGGPDRNVSTRPGTYYLAIRL